VRAGYGNRPMQLGGLRLRASYRLILALMTAAMVGALTGVAAAAQDGPSALPAAGGGR